MRFSRSLTVLVLLMYGFGGGQRSLDDQLEGVYEPLEDFSDEVRIAAAAITVSGSLPHLVLASEPCSKHMKPSAFCSEQRRFSIVPLWRGLGCTPFLLVRLLGAHNVSVLARREILRNDAGPGKSQGIQACVIPETTFSLETSQSIASRWQNLGRPAARKHRSAYARRKN